MDNQDLSLRMDSQSFISSKKNDPIKSKNKWSAFLEILAFIASIYSIIIFFLWLSDEKSGEVSTTALFTNEIIGTRKDVEMDDIAANVSTTLCPNWNTTCTNTNIHGMQKFTLDEMTIKQGLFASWISSCKPPIFFILSLGFFGQMFFVTYQEDRNIVFGLNVKFLYTVYYLLLHSLVFIMIVVSVWTRTNVYSQLALLFPLLFVYASNVVNNLRNISGSFGGVVYGNSVDLNKRYLQDISAFSAASLSCMFLFLIFSYKAHLYMTVDDITQSFVYFLTSQLVLNVVFHIELKSNQLEINAKRFMVFVLLIVSLILLVFSWINVYERIVILKNSKEQMEYSSKNYHIPIIIVFFVFHAMSTLLNMGFIAMGKLEVLSQCIFIFIFFYFLFFHRGLTW